MWNGGRGKVQPGVFRRLDGVAASPRLHIHPDGFKVVEVAANIPKHGGPLANKEHTRGMAVPYIDSRAIQNRLDSVVGIYNWKPAYRPWHQVEKVDKDRQQKGASRSRNSRPCRLFWGE